MTMCHGSHLPLGMVTYTFAFSHFTGQHLTCIHLLFTYMISFQRRAKV